MNTHRLTLEQHLQLVSWRHLLAILAAHGLSITTSQAKATLLPQLQKHLTSPVILAASITQLDPVGKDALRALLAADGALPVHTFEQRFGPIRPYRPWRKAEPDNAVAPWLAPISATETLWYFGLIFRDPPKPKPGQGQHYAIPADLIPPLTDLLRQPASAMPTTTVPLPGHHGPLAHHLAIWLATVSAPHQSPRHQSQAIKPVHQRWLSPSVVALLCQRLGLPPKRGAHLIRSERHLPYLAFLHSLALAADFITITPLGFQLTPTAWAWLTAASDARQQQLVTAWRTTSPDLAHRFSFRWEPLSRRARDFVMQQLSRLTNAPPIALPTLCAQWRLLDSDDLLPAPRLATWYDETSTYDPLHHLLTGPLHWLGLITLLATDPLPPDREPVAPPPALVAPPPEREPFGREGELVAAPPEREPFGREGKPAEEDLFETLSELIEAPPELVEGELVEGELVEGELVEGELVEGELVEDELVEDELVEDELVKEELVEGKPISSLFILHSPFSIHHTPALCTMPKQPTNTIHAPLTVQPVHLVRLARFCDWRITPPPTVTPHTFTLAPERIAQLAAQGLPSEQCLEQLAAALGRPPSRRISQRILQWAEAGQHLRLRTLLVLEADTADRLAQVRRHKLVRNRLGETIAPNRMTLRPADAAALAQTLRTLGYYVEPPASALPEPVEGSAETRGSQPPPFPEREPFGREGQPVEGGLSPMLQWFLLTLYHGLGQHLPLPIDLPWNLRQTLRPQLTPLQQADAEGAAQQLLARFQSALTGYLQLPAWTLPSVIDATPIIEQALATGDDLEIRYRGPTANQVTTRTITPYWLETRHQTRYLIGWCHLRQQERTFRLDRIEAIQLQPRA